MPDPERPPRPETIAVHAGRPAREADAPLNQPPVLASAFHAEGPMGYARHASPTPAAFEAAMGELEGGEAVAFASGMGAIAAVVEELPAGARVVAPAIAYIDTRNLLQDRAQAGKLELTAVDISDTAATLAACRGADLLWVESPSNPLLEVAELDALCRGAQKAGARIAVDGTFATPLLQQPLELGADVVVHSATKFIGGHSDLLLGVAVTRDPDRAQRLRRARDTLGAAPGPLECFLALRGLRTLPLRLERSQSNAGELARRLHEHPEVQRVRYPGLPGDPAHERASRLMRGPGAVLAFEVRGGAARADGLCAAVEVLTSATSLGGVETLIERRNRWPGEEAIPPALLRMSVGCEHVEDLWADLERALEVSGGAAQAS